MLRSIRRGGRNNPHQMKFTTSWDDGYTLDLKVADMLANYGATGTFYVCPRKQHQHEMLSPDQIAELSKSHEIGAHSLRHPWLTQVSSIEAKQEIEESKAWVEQLTAKECKMFCYPFGDYNDSIKEIVKTAGFKGARTTEDLRFSSDDPYAMPTTLQVTPFPKRKRFSRWWHPLDLYGPLRVRQSRLRALEIKREDTKSWLSLAVALFDKSLQATANNQQPFFHLWGHSHEIERYGLWQDFEMFLKHVKDSGVECCTNSDLL